MEEKERVCFGPCCDSTSFCKAHIIPQGFARTLSGPTGHNLAVSHDGAKPANQPLGPFDQQILCANCDGKLGVFDQSAIGYCNSLPMTGSAPTGRMFQGGAFNGATFSLAMLAILWRASISSRAEWAGISLGRYENQAAAVLFGQAELTSFPVFDVIVMRYASTDHDARKFIFPLLRIRSAGLNVFSWGVGGFQVLAKIDQRPFDRRLRPFIVNKAEALVVPHVRLEETAEFAFFNEAARADRRRRRS
jgi:hypothetical protein